MTVLKGTDINVYGQCGCLICGEGVPLSSPLDKGPRICNKCKGAVMHVRKVLEQPPEGDVNVNSDPDEEYSRGKIE